MTTGFSADATSTAVKVQPDGKILVVGYTSVACASGLNQYALARYEQDGSLDSSFGIAGTTTTDWGTAGAELTDVALQSDGSIVVVGRRNSGDCSTGESYSTITRYTTDGVLDTTFAHNGELIYDIPYGPSDDSINAVVIGDDDRIYAAAQDYFGSWAGILRADETGAFQGLSNLSSGYMRGLVFDDVGLLAVSEQQLMIRYDLDGSIDSSFANVGMRFGLYPCRQWH